MVWAWVSLKEKPAKSVLQGEGGERDDCGSTHDTMSFCRACMPSCLAPTQPSNRLCCRLAVQDSTCDSNQQDAAGKKAAEMAHLASSSCTLAASTCTIACKHDQGAECTTGVR